MQPAMDDIAIHDINTGLFAYPAVLVAHKIGLFDFVAAAPRTAAEIADRFALHPRAIDAILGVCVGTGFLEAAGDRFSATPLTQHYMVRESPTTWAYYLDSLIANHQMYSYPRVEDCLLRNRPQMYEGRELFGVNAADQERANDFTRWMHSVSVGPAAAWPRTIDLAGRRHLLDVGGGSGAHAMAAAEAFPDLTATVFELETVCRIAGEYIAARGLEGRVHTRPGNFWTDPFPAADVHFYSQIFHDWSHDECVTLARKSFDALPGGGLLVLHELLMNDDRTGPLPAVVVNLMMCLLYSTGKQYSGSELVQILVEAGFENASVIPTFGHWHLVRATKPR